MSQIAIRGEHLGKRYRIGARQTQYRTIREALAEAVAAPFRRRGSASAAGDANPHIWALKDVSFEIMHGQVVGIIGRNGAGKTTLLKILSRITKPTEGHAEIHGRVGSLLEVGTGFHPELTGRENTYLNGAILGMKKREIDHKFNEIVAFAEIDRFIDTPVKHYSSGMYVRLAFAVAAHLEPEILLVDEVLAVGDAQFQKKCLGKMDDVAQEGRTVLLVSHNMAAVRHLCAKTIWIDQGQLVRFASTGSVIDDYLSSGKVEGGEFYSSPSEGGAGNQKARLRRVSIRNQHRAITDAVAMDSPFYVEIEYELDRPLENVRVGYRLVANDGTVVFTSGDTDPAGLGTSRKPGVYISRCMVPGNLLNNGRYHVTVACDIPMQEVLFLAETVVSFAVQLTGGVGSAVPDGRLGVVRPSLQWDVSLVNDTP